MKYIPFPRLLREELGGGGEHTILATHLTVVFYMLSIMQVDLVMVLGWGIIIIIIILGIIKMFLVFPGLLELKLKYREGVVEVVRDEIVLQKGPKEQKISDMENIENTVDEKHRISNENKEFVISRKIPKDYGEYFSVEIFEKNIELAVVKHIDNEEDGKTLLDMEQRQN